MQIEMCESTVEYVIEMAQSGLMAESQRARLHAATRKFTISDEELAAALQKITDRPDVLAFVLNLRDRYEERGFYAVTSPASQEPAKEFQPSPNSQDQPD